MFQSYFSHHLYLVRKLQFAAVSFRQTIINTHFYCIEMCKNEMCPKIETTPLQPNPKILQLSVLFLLHFIQKIFQQVSFFFIMFLFGNAKSEPLRCKAFYRLLETQVGEYWVFWQDVSWYYFWARIPRIFLMYYQQTIL